MELCSSLINHSRAADRSSSSDVRNCKMQNAQCKMQNRPSGVVSDLRQEKANSSFCILHFCLLVLLAGTHAARADDSPTDAQPAKPPVKQKLLERTPFDAITLTKAAGGAT